jgi:hypothetical protein
MSDEKSDEKKNLTGKEDQETKAEEVTAESVFEKLPPEVKKVMEIGFSMQRFSGPVPLPFLTKINETHISKILSSQRKMMRGLSQTRNHQSDISLLMC